MDDNFSAPEDAPDDASAAASVDPVPHGKRETDVRRWWRNPKTRVLLSLAALGVVFGDIGTSPLYAMTLLFTPESPHRIDPSESNVYGVVSTVFWLVTVVVTVKYASLILRADNGGEGGIIAIFTLLRERLSKHRSVVAVTVIGLLGMALFLGDAVITPAISVLSAVEGVTVVLPSTQSFVVPAVIVILFVLFVGQKFGTKQIGKLFGPTMLIWFIVIAVMGIAQILRNPKILQAVNPAYVVEFIAHNPILFIGTLSVLLLTITGVEALYADLGHFGRKPIFSAWMFIAFPALAVNYMGQGALVLHYSEKNLVPKNLFFEMVPTALVLPLTVLATFATIIAAQAVISGAFSLVAQSARLRFLPRTRLQYPSGMMGQVYVPVVNWGLFIIVSILVISFGSSEKLANAYGISVAACMICDTVLFFTFAYLTWRKPRLLTFTVAIIFGVIDFSLFLSCIPKIVTGAWFPLVLAGVIFFALWSWYVGRTYITAARETEEGNIDNFVETLNEHPDIMHITRLPSTGVFLHHNPRTVPLSMKMLGERFHALHENNIIVSVKTADQPTVPDEDKIEVDTLGYDDGVWEMNLLIGFNEQQDVPQLVAQAAQAREDMSTVDLDNATYYVSKFETDHIDVPNLPKIMERVFVGMKDAENDPIMFFHLPLDRTMLIGTTMPDPKNPALPDSVE